MGDDHVIGGIVVYYRAGFATLLATVTAALASPALAPERLLLVDSASGDGVVEAVSTKAGTRHLVLPTNRGYASAVRAGLANLSPDLDPVLVLTHECVLEPGAIEALLTAMTDNVGIAAPRLTLASGAPWSDGGRFGGLLRRPHHELVQPFVIRRVDWVDGAAMLCRRALLEQLPADYGMYFEDAELGWIAHEQRLDVVVVGAARAAQETNGMPSFALSRGWVRFQRRTRGRAAAAITALGLLGMATLRLLCGRRADALELTRGVWAGWRQPTGRVVG